MLPYNYLLFDAARAEKALYEAIDMNKNYRSLYKGTAEEDLEGVAPYLFSIQPNSPFADWYIKNGWNNSWGLLIHANMPFDDLYKHFRKFLMVKTEDGEQLYFRFYDPRVLRVFLPTCDKPQLIEFFGPIKSFFTEHEEAEMVFQFSFENYILNTKTHTLKDVFGEIALISENAETVSADASEEEIKELVVEEKIDASLPGNKEEPVNEKPQTENTQPLEEPVKKKRNFF